MGVAFAADLGGARDADAGVLPARSRGSWSRSMRAGIRWNSATRFSAIACDALLDEHNAAHARADAASRRARLPFALRPRDPRCLRACCTGARSSRRSARNSSAADLAHFLDGDAALRRPTAGAVSASAAGSAAGLASRSAGSIRSSLRTSPAASRTTAIPVLLRDWIRTDGLQLPEDQTARQRRGVGLRRASCRSGGSRSRKACDWLTADFNCTVTDPAYVNDILDRLLVEQPRIYGMLLYVEQPFPYDLEANRIDVRSVSARKPLFLDESAHDWRFVRLGRELGWTGVALKTCKTQTGALLSLCWAQGARHDADGAGPDQPDARADPARAARRARRHDHGRGEQRACSSIPTPRCPRPRCIPALFRRRDGVLDLTTLRGPGFGYRVDEIGRELPPAPSAL